MQHTCKFKLKNQFQYNLREMLEHLRWSVVLLVSFCANLAQKKREIERELISSCSFFLLKKWCKVNTKESKKDQNKCSGVSLNLI